MLLEELTNTEKLENGTMECKKVLDRKDPTSWLKTIAGFANASGGKLYIGVEDKSQKVIGFTRKEADAERNYFNNQVNEHITPRPNTMVDFIPYEIREQERLVLKVTIGESPVKPVLLKINGVPAIYMRRDGYTNAATYEEIREMSIHSTSQQFDTLSSDLSYKEEDFTQLNAFSLEHGGKKFSDKMFRSMGFFDQDKKLKKGGVLFMDSYDGSKTAVQCSQFSGFTRGSDRIVSVNRFRGNITSSITFMENFVDARMNHMIIKHDDYRENFDSYPKRAVFEGLVNAAAHRDYYLDGTQIQVDLFKDRLEISSPGSFYEGALIGKSYDLSDIISKRRNELICEVLVHCNVMEAAGTGFDKIAEEYQDADQGHKPYIYSASDHFTLVLPDLTYEPGIHKGITEDAISFVPVTDASKHDGSILAFCYASARKSSEIAKHLGVADSSYFRTKILKRLEEAGYLETVKLGRALAYKTNHSIVGLK